MTAVQVAGIVLVCTLLGCAALAAAAWTLIAVGRMHSRSRCAVCQGGGHAGDYPTPQNWAGDPYRMCTKHLAANRRRAYLERNLR